MVRHAYGPGDVERIHYVPERVRRMQAHHGAPVIRRPFRATWQFQSAVMVCKADLRLLILPAWEAAYTGDPYSQIDEDGVDRVYVRCTRAVWQGLAAHHPAGDLDHIRRALAQVYTLDGSPRSPAVLGGTPNA